jgi:superfamily II DNA/RNA helicase
VLWATADPPHIIVGNPTSLLRLVDAGKLRLKAVNTVVVDEVDVCLIERHTRQELHSLLSRHLSSSYTTAENGKRTLVFAVEAC